MTSPAPNLSIRDVIGDALRFAVENWRLALLAAGAGALVHLAAFFISGGGGLWLAALFFASVGVYSALTIAALKGAGAVRAELTRAAPRVAASIGIAGFFVGIIVLMVVYLSMSVLIAPYADEVRAAQENQQQLMAIMNRAVEEQPGVLLWALVAGALIVMLITSRFYLSVPASVDQNRIIAFESWRWTRGQTLRIFAARVGVLGPALILVGALQALIGIALGLGSDPLAIANRSGANPTGFGLYYGGALFVQIALYANLEAGLSAAIYRRLTPPSAA